MRGWLFFLLVVVAGCGSPRPVEVVTRSGEPDVVQVSADDRRLDEARQEARSTLPQFVEALQAPLKAQKRFSIKAEFVEGPVHEYMWLRDVKPEGFDFIGTLSNRPIQLQKIKIGQRVRVKLPAVADWMYIHGDTLVGGYTIRVLAEGLAPEARAHMETEGGFKL